MTVVYDMTDTVLFIPVDDTFIILFSILPACLVIVEIIGEGTVTYLAWSMWLYGIMLVCPVIGGRCIILYNKQICY